MTEKLRTIDEYIYDELHRIFVHVAEVVANAAETPDEAAGIPYFTFQAENYMRAAWDRYVESQQ